MVQKKPVKIIKTYRTFYEVFFFFLCFFMIFQDQNGTKNVYLKDFMILLFCKRIYIMDHFCCKDFSPGFLKVLKLAKYGHIKRVYRRK